MRNIMVATDSSAAGIHAVDIAAELAKAFDGKLLTVTVADNLTGENTRELFRSHRGFGEALGSHSTQILAEPPKSALSALTNIQLQIGWRPGTIDHGDCRAGGHDVIVIGRRGRGELAGSPLGTMAQKVVSLAPRQCNRRSGIGGAVPDDAPWS